MAAKPGHTSIPGVESLRRCLVGQTSGPASSPSASRLVEAVCVQLCNLYPTGTRVHGGARGTRWDSALLQYRHIRELVLGHQRLMARVRTLSLWFTRTQREKERAVLTPGVAADGGRPPAAAAATAPGPASAVAVDRPAAAATATSAVPQGRATTAAARGAAVAPAAAPAVAAPVPALPEPVARRRLLAPRQPAPSAAYPAFPPTAAAAAAAPLLVDLSLPRQSVWVLPPPPPDAPSDIAGSTSPPSAAGHRTARWP
ncbi:translation initiation factor IF-2-like [Gadus chalcogrammus]|uniref:translation initiation factor IF-2-like n=1 Tax=Gadus chalcogrammus TaxID=1042646 RepID=UPI0024C48319|nr:translation initiation factor IF-2-like [Gadus chalcogrammus]